MKAISFLGTGDYKTTDYLFPNGQLESTEYFPFAVNEVYEPDDHYMFLTKDSSEKHLERLSELFKFHEVIIPSGTSEDEYWEIFDDFCEILDDNDEVIFDITFGFRSLPVLGISALLFLRELKGIKIKKILYGALEAKNNDHVPVFDLTTFIDVVDWSLAVREFIRFGRAFEISRLMSDIQKDAHLRDVKLNSLKSSGKALVDLTNAMSMSNLQGVFEHSREFGNKSKGLINNLGKVKQTKPFNLLLNKIMERVSPIVEADENDLFNAMGINAQFNIIDWLLQTGQYQQAITFMNELFISFECLETKSNPLQKENRLKASESLGSKIQEMKNNQDKSDEKASLWNDLSKTRNEINHASIRKGASNVNRQVNKVTELFRREKDYYEAIRFQIGHDSHLVH